MDKDEKKFWDDLNKLVGSSPKLIRKIKLLKSS